MDVEDANFQEKLDATNQQGRVDFAGNHEGNGGSGQGSDDPPRKCLGQAMPVRGTAGTRFWRSRTGLPELCGLNLRS